MAQATQAPPAQAAQSPVAPQQQPPPPQAPAAPGYGAAPSPWTSGTPYAHPGYDLSNAMAQGTADAEEDTNGTLWFFVGCLGLLGILIAYVAEPTPPPARFMGKPPEYVMGYTQAYKSAGKSAQGKHALIGCAVGTGIALAIYFIIVVAVIDNASMQP